jgi:NAD(P)-dependent dehydrogenase (short-subunit alcohol dehydrogenase family)
MKMLPLGTSNNQDFDATFATNVRGTFNVLKQAARRLADGSRIVTLSTSVTALSLHVPGTAGTSRDARGHRERRVVPRRFRRRLGQWTGAARQWRVRLEGRIQ